MTRQTDKRFDGVNNFFSCSAFSQLTTAPMDSPDRVTELCQRLDSFKQPERPSLWNTPFVKLVRWILFMPLALGCLLLLEPVPRFVFHLTADYEIHLTFLMLCLAVIAISFGLTLVWIYCMAVFYVPALACRIVAPSYKPACLIFGTAYVLLDFVGIVSMAESGASLKSLVFHTVFALVVLAGTVSAYHLSESE